MDSVLPKRFDPRKALTLAVGLFCLLHTPEFDQRVTARLLSNHAMTEIVFDVQLEVTFELGVEVF